MPHGDALVADRVLRVGPRRRATEPSACDGTGHLSQKDESRVMLVSAEWPIPSRGIRRAGFEVLGEHRARAGRGPARALLVRGLRDCLPKHWSDVLRASAWLGRRPLTR